MKEIDVEKVRSAILSLQANGKHEFASIVWDLLDNYVSQKPRPIVMRQDGVQAAHDHVKAAKEIVRSLRGASAFANAPLCQISRFNAAEQHCESLAAGSLNAHANNQSWMVCAKHGEMYDDDREDSPYAVDWVQTFFGDENSAADVAEYQARMTI
jgi:hypothetical protein